MAIEFNLGRVRPHYSGAYSQSKSYSYYDWVTDGGSSYICVNAEGVTGGETESLKTSDKWAVMARGGNTAGQEDLGVVSSDACIQASERLTTLTLGANITISFTDGSAGDFHLLVYNPDNHEIVWSGVKWSGGSAPQLTTRRNALFHFVSGDGSVFFGSMVGGDYNV